MPKSFQNLEFRILALQEFGPLTNSNSAQITRPRNTDTYVKKPWPNYRTKLDPSSNLVEAATKHSPTLLDETSYRYKLALNLKRKHDANKETKSACSVYDTRAVRGHNDRVKLGKTRMWLTEHTEKGKKK